MLLLLLSLLPNPTLSPLPNLPLPLLPNWLLSSSQPAAVPANCHGLSLGVDSAVNFSATTPNNRSHSDAWRPQPLHLTPTTTPFATTSHNTTPTRTPRIQLPTIGIGQSDLTMEARSVQDPRALAGVGLLLEIRRKRLQHKSRDTKRGTWAVRYQDCKEEVRGL